MMEQATDAGLKGCSRTSEKTGGRIASLLIITLGVVVSVVVLAQIVLRVRELVQ